VSRFGGKSRYASGDQRVMLALGFRVYQPVKRREKNEP